MKRFVKIALCTIFLALAGIDAGAQIGISGYFINSSLRDKEGNKYPGFSGFQGDLTYNLKFVRVFGIESGAGYVYLRRKEDSKVVSTYAAECYSQEQQIRIPLHLTLDINIKNGFGFFIFAGGAVNYTISGINAISVAFPEGTATLTYDYCSGVEGRKNLSDTQYAIVHPELNTTGRMRRFDAMAEGGIGIKLNSFVMVRGGYSHSFINRYTSEYDGYARRRQITAGLTLLF